MKNIFFKLFLTSIIFILIPYKTYSNRGIYYASNKYLSNSTITPSTNKIVSELKEQSDTSNHVELTKKKLDTINEIQQFNEYLKLSNDEQFILKDRKIYAQKAIKLIENNKDLLKKIDAYSSYGYILAQEGRFSEVFKVYSHIKELSDSLGYYNESDFERKAYFLNIEGILYKEMAIYDKALNAYYKSLYISDSINWMDGQTTVLNNISNLYFIKEDFNTALSLQLKSLKIANKTKDFGKIYDANFNLMLMYSNLKQADSASYYADKAYKLLPQFNSYYQNCYFFESFAQILFDNQKYKLSEENYHKCLSIAKANSFIELKLKAYYGLGIIAENKNETNLAIEYYSKALKLSKDLNIPSLKTKALKKLSSQQFAKEDYKSAYTCLQEAMILNDSINKSWKNIKDSEIRQYYQLELEKNEKKILLNNLSITKVKLHYRNYFLIILALLIIILLWLIYFIFQKKKKEKELNDKAIADTNTINEQQKLLRQKEEERLKQTLDAKTRELVAFSLSSIKHVNATEDILIKIKNIVYNEPIKESTKKELIKITQQMKNDLIKSDWEEFKTYYEQVHPSFYINLIEKHPDLTANEEKLCAFISLGLNTKDIASLTYRQTKSVDTARLRLRKKLNLNSTDNLFEYLRNF